MAFFRLRLSDAETQRELALELRVGQIELPAAIQPVHQFLVLFVASPKPEADQVQRRWRHDFKAVIRSYPPKQLLCKFHVPADMVLQPLDSIVTDHQPKL